MSAISTPLPFTDIRACACSPVFRGQSAPPVYEPGVLTEALHWPNTTLHWPNTTLHYTTYYTTLHCTTLRKARPSPYHEVFLLNDCQINTISHLNSIWILSNQIEIWNSKRNPIYSRSKSKNILKMLQTIQEIFSQKYTSSIKSYSWLIATFRK